MMALRPMPHTSNVDYDEAIRLPREGIRQRNDFAGTLRPQPWRVRWISQGHAARVAPRTAQHFSGLDGEPPSLQAR